MTTTKTDAQTVLDALEFYANNVRYVDFKPTRDFSLNGIQMDNGSRAKNALPAAQRLADGWLPIETAPKDGTRILVNNIFPWGYLTDEEPMGVASWNKTYTGKYHWISNACCDGVSDFNPTHWMPLPNPPTTSEEA